MDLTVFAQTDPTTIIPDGIPAWLWVILAGAAGWFAKELWPFFKTRVERAEKADAAQDERFLRAYEQTAQALEKVSQSLDLFARNSVAMTFEIAELRREIRGRKDETPPSVTLERMLRQEPTP